MFSVLCGFCEAVVGHSIMLLFIVFRGISFCETVRCIWYENRDCLNTFNTSFSDFNENRMPKT